MDKEILVAVLGLVAAAIGLVGSVIGRKKVIVHRHERSVESASPPSAHRVVVVHRRGNPEDVEDAQPEPEMTKINREIFWYTVFGTLFGIGCLGIHFFVEKNQFLLWVGVVTMSVPMFFTVWGWFEK